jgi:peptide/nickel transport system substrate-binding protein
MGYIFNNGSVMPWLAESRNVSSDSKIYTFKLRPNVRLHDGVPLTSDDAIFTFELAKNVGNRTANPIYALRGKYIDRVDKIDNLTFRIVLSQSYMPFLIYDLSMYILPKHISDPIRYSNDNMIGLGPYRLVSKTPGVKYVLHASN